MKYYLSLLFLACVSVSFAQSSPVTFTDTTHSFGKIKQGVPVTTEFSFTNSSAKPVIIEVATAECGCTTPDYPKKPVMKGQTASIKVTYNSESEGHFEKQVTVKFARIAQPVILTINGDVEKKTK